jgi:hypothetical protein
LNPEERVPGRKPRLKRLPAAEVEGIVIDAVARLLASTRDLEEALNAPEPSVEQARYLVEASMRLAGNVRAESTERNALIRSFLAGVVLAQGAIKIMINRLALEDSLRVGTSDETPRASVATKKRIAVSATGTTVSDHHIITVAASVRMRGIEVRFVIEGCDIDRKPEPDASLIRVVVQGHDWFQRLLTGQARSLQDIASAEGVTDRYVRRLIDLAFLAPEITTGILDGTQPVDLTAEKVTRFVDLPLAWRE